MAKRYFLLIFFMFSLFVYGQQMSNLSQWISHQYTFNPAYTGIKQCMEVQGTVRGQWIKINGAPITGWVSVHSPLSAKRKKFLSARHGLGGMASFDKIGPFQDIRLQFSYAGHFNFTIDNRLSLGLAFGARQLSFNIQEAKPLDPDPVINGSASQILPIATFGAWWNGKKYFIGFSLTELIPQKWKVIGMNARYQMHAILTGGYKFQLNPKFTLVPGIYLSYTKNTPINMQIHALFEYNRAFSFGLGFRNTDALIGMIGFRIKEQWKIGYAYDFILSKLRPNTVHTHELTFSFSPCKNYSEGTSSCPTFD